MQNNLIFTQFDAVVSMTEQTINDQLVHLLRTGTIKPSLILVQAIDSSGKDFTYSVLNDGDPIPPNSSYINGQIMPQIAIKESGHNISFILNFTGGTAAFWVGFGPASKLVEYDMTGWAYGISVNMDLYALQQKDIGSKIAVPPSVKAQLSQFTDSMFTVNSLFLDFESVDLLNFDPNATNTANAGDVGIQQLVMFMQFYLKWLISTGNPYVLGYAIGVNSATKVDPTLTVPPALTFTGTDYTMYSDPNTAGLSNLNFTLVSQGGFGTVAGSPGVFDTNWISPTEQCSAKMIIAHQDLLETLFTQPLYASLQTGVFNQLNGHVDVPAGNTYTQARSNTATGLHFNISNIASGDDQYSNSFDVSFTNASGQTTINFNGLLHVRKEVSKNMGVCTADAWADCSVSWTQSLTIMAAKDTAGSPTLTVAVGQINTTPTQDSHQNDCAKGFEWIGKILGAIVDLFIDNLDNGFFKNLFGNLLSTPIPGVGDISVAFTNFGKTLPAAVLLPAGQVFFFKNPAFDNEGNFSLELTYISNQDGVSL
jgi:hypothetical protein